MWTASSFRRAVQPQPDNNQQPVLERQPTQTPRTQPAGELHLLRARAAPNKVLQARSHDRSPNEPQSPIKGHHAHQSDVRGGVALLEPAPSAGPDGRSWFQPNTWPSIEVMVSTATTANSIKPSALMDTHTTLPNDICRRPCWEANR
jgi:hypothetical protein